MINQIASSPTGLRRPAWITLRREEEVEVRGWVIGFAHYADSDPAVIVELEDGTATLVWLENIRFDDFLEQRPKEENLDFKLKDMGAGYAGSAKPALCWTPEALENLHALGSAFRPVRSKLSGAFYVAMPIQDDDMLLWVEGFKDGPKRLIKGDWILRDGAENFHTYSPERFAQQFEEL